MVGLGTRLKVTYVRSAHKLHEDVDHHVSCYAFDEAVELFIIVTRLT